MARIFVQPLEQPGPRRGGPAAAVGFGERRALLHQQLVQRSQCIRAAGCGELPCRGTLGSFSPEGRHQDKKRKANEDLSAHGGRLIPFADDLKGTPAAPKRDCADFGMIQELRVRNSVRMGNWLFTASLALLLSCKREAPAAPALATEALKASDSYEIEIKGTLLERLKAPRYLVLLTPEPCDVRKLATTYLKATGHPDPTTPKRDFYLEPVGRAGERQYLCAAALDASGLSVLAYSAYPKNPLVFPARQQGKEDAELEDLDFELSPLDHPVKLPSARF